MFIYHTHLFIHIIPPGATIYVPHQLLNTLYHVYTKHVFQMCTHIHHLHINTQYTNLSFSHQHTQCVNTLYHIISHIHKIHIQNVFIHAHHQKKKYPFPLPLFLNIVSSLPARCHSYHFLSSLSPVFTNSVFIQHLVYMMHYIHNNYAFTYAHHFFFPPFVPTVHMYITHFPLLSCHHPRHFPSSSPPLPIIKFADACIIYNVHNNNALTYAHHSCYFSRFD